MKYYILSFKNREYVLDISFFIDLLIESIDTNIDLILDKLNIRVEEIEQDITLDSDKTYILHGSEIIEFKLTFDFVQYIKSGAINRFYEIDSANQINLMNQISLIDYNDMLTYLNIKYENFKIDKETAYLDILNSGDVGDIELLEKFLEFNEYSHQHTFYHSTEEEKIINQYDNLNELVISLIIYLNLHRYDYNSLSVSKQLSTLGE